MLLIKGNSDVHRGPDTLGQTFHIKIVVKRLKCFGTHSSCTNPPPSLGAMYGPLIYSHDNDLGATYHFEGI
jgi:hypothetical protein